MMISWPPWKSWKQPSGPRASLWRWFLKGRSWTTPTTKNASSTCITTAPTWPSSASMWDTAACGKPCCTCSTRWDPQTRLSHGCTCLAHLAWPTQLSGGPITPLNLTPGFSCRIILGRVKSRWQILGISLLVQWLGLCTCTAEDPGSIPGQGTRILWVVWHEQKKKKHTNGKFSLHKSCFDEHAKVLTWISDCPSHWQWQIPSLLPEHTAELNNSWECGLWNEMLGMSGVTLGKLLNFCFHTLPTCSGLCPAGNPAVRPLGDVTTKTRKHPWHRS